MPPPMLTASTAGSLVIMGNTSPVGPERVLTDAKTSIRADSLSDELRYLRKGRGIRAGRPAEAIGGQLRELAGITEGDSSSSVQTKLRDIIGATSDDLSPEARLAIKAAFGLDPAPDGLLQERIEWLARELDRGDRTARRLIEASLGMLVDKLMTRKPSTLAHGPGSYDSLPVNETEASSAAHEPRHFTPHAPLYAFDLVVLPAALKNRIVTTATLLDRGNTVFDDWRLSEIGADQFAAFNFYGPPGIGKTMAAHAVADLLGRPIIQVRPGLIESPYIGETPKNIDSLFRAAEREGAILFFDEADVWLSRRIESPETVADHVLNSARAELLMWLDGYHGLVIFATNSVSSYDPAFLRRLIPFEFMPPTEAERIEIFWRHIPDPMPLAADVTEESIIPLLHGLMGRDIRRLIIDAAMNAVLDGSPAVSHTHFASAANGIAKSLPMTHDAQEQPPMADRRSHLIFISYRGSDQNWATEPVYARMTEAFGADTVFKAGNALRAGEEFPAIVKREAASCPVMLACIGPEWLTATAPDGSRRLDSPADWVQEEIAISLQAGNHVVPLLIGNRNEVALPKPDQVPESIRAMVYRQALWLAPGRGLDATIPMLVDCLAELVPELAERRRARSTTQPASVAQAPRDED